MERETYRYNLSDLDDDQAIGILLPINRQDGRFNQSYTTEEQAISNLKNLLLTAKGERLMLPDYGSNLPKYLFENIYDSLLFDIETEIRDTIGKWLPYINILDIRVTTNDYNSNMKTDLEYHTIYFEITFRVQPYNNDTRIVFFTDESGTNILEETINE